MLTLPTFDCRRRTISLPSLVRPLASHWIALGRRMAVVTLTSVSISIAAQSPSNTHPNDLSASPRSWAEAASITEQRVIYDDGNFPIRYLVRKVDSKNDVTREVIETRQGSVARLVQRNGQPLTAVEDADERERLTDILKSPKDFAKHHKRDAAARSYALQLVRQMPSAMIFSYAPGQPQRPNFATPQVVLDCLPDPGYKPPTIISEVLTGLQGRLWIDRKTMHILRIEGRVLRPVDFGWGMLARIYPGGTAEFEQTNAGGDRWVYSLFRESATIREMMVKTVQQHATMDTAEFQLLPAPLDYQEAIRILLAKPLDLR